MSGGDPRPLRVAVTLEQCWHRVPGGTATATLGSIRALLTHDVGVALDLVGVAAHHRRPPPRAFTPPIPTKRIPLPRPALYEAWHGLRWPPVDDVTGPVDVIHATAMAVPPRTAPLVVTVHDLAFLADPSRSTPRGLRFFRRSIELAKSEADLVVCPSAATAAECVAEGFDPDRLRIVPWGIDARVASDEEVARVRQRHGLPGRYALWVGTAEPRKNLDGLLRAWQRVVTTGTDAELVVVGPPGWNLDLAALMGSTPGIRILGEVPGSDLAPLYRGAELLCFPSHREGFGMPVLEAMAQGTPVVTSLGTATEEVGRGAALLVDPNDDRAIAEAVASLLDDPGERARRSGLATERAAAFGGAATATGLARVYRDAATQPTTRVGVDLLWLVPGEVGGTETYATRLIDAWGRTEPDPSVVPVLMTNRRFAAAHPDLARRHRVVTAPIDGASRIRRVLAGAAWVPWASRAHRLDLVHHLGGTVPPVGGVPSVVTIHDLQPLSHPESFRPLKRAYLRAGLPHAVRRATIVSTLSRFVRDDVVARLDVDPARVEVVPPGFDPPQVGAGADDGAWHSVRERYGLGEQPYFLYPSITYPHKNHLVLVDALVGLPDGVVLVLTGGTASAEQDLLRAIEAHGVGARVRRTGHISESDLILLYRHAAALVYPSRYEGFGLPVLEAMDLGCPVLAADNTALAETVGDAGILLPPEDPGAWTAAMAALLDDPGLRRDLVERGARRVTAFRWEDSATSLARTYHRALDLGRGRATRPEEMSS